MEQIEATVKTFKSCLQPTLYQLTLVQTECQVRSVLFVRLESGSYRELTHSMEHFSSRARLFCKVLTFLQPVAEQLVEVQLPRSTTPKEFKIAFDHGSFTVTSRILNSTQQQVTPAMMLTPMQHIGYDKFLQYRRKVKKLENITSPLNWQVAHRIRVQHHLQTYMYDMEDDNQVCIDASLDSLVTFQVEEQSFVASENRLVETIAQCVVSLKQVSSGGSMEVAMKLSQYLTVRFTVETVMTELKQQQGLMSLRLLEAPANVVTIQIGLVEERSTQLSQFQALKPVKVENDKAYFDPQYYFLERNLKSIEGSQEAIEKLDSLTKAFPEYPHVKNQQLLPLSIKAKYLCIVVGYAKGHTQCIQLPTYNLLVGLNSVVLPELEGTSSQCLRFYMEIHKTTDQQCSKKHRIFSLQPQTIWNAYALPEGQNLSLRLLSNRTVLQAAFKMASKDMLGSDKEVRRELQKLESRNQLEVPFQNDRFVVCKTAGKTAASSYRVIEPPSHLQPEGLLLSETLCNQAVMLQVCIDGDIVAFGPLFMKELLREGRVIVPLQTTFKECSYVFIVLRYKQRESATNISAARLYKIAYSMTTLTPSEGVSYELHLTNLQKTSKQFKRKLDPQPAPSSFKQLDFCLMQKNKQAELSLLVRRRYYDDLTESYNYHEYLSKNISFNKNSRITDSNFENISVREGSYEVVSWQFFAEDTLQHITFQLQVGCFADEVLDVTGKGFGYAVKMLPIMWNKVKGGLDRSPNSVNFEVITSKKGGRDGLPKSKDFTYMNTMESTLKASDYRDGLSVMVGQHHGYSKIYELIRLRVNISKNEIDLQGESQYSLACITLDGIQLLFLLRLVHGVVEADSDSDAKSEKSSKTVGKQGKGDKRDAIDDFNKTIKLNDVLQLKTEINNITQANRKLVTRVVRMENNNSVLQQKLQEIKQIGERKKQQLKYAGKTHQDKYDDPAIEEARQKKRKLFRDICGCGARNPKYMGYCEQCLKELQKTYRLVYKQFEDKAKQYESTFYRNMLRKEKIQMLEGKINNVKDRLLMRQTQQDAKSQSEDITEQHTLRELKEKLAEYKNSSTTSRIRIEGVIESGSHLQQNLEQKINSQNRQIFELVQQIEQCRRRKTEMDTKIQQLSEGSRLHAPS